MQINTVGNQHSQAKLQVRQNHSLQRGPKEQVATSANISEQPETIPIEHQQSIDEAKGVIRLLQEGHFKGVTDLRLRINFHEELQSIHSYKQNNLLQEKAATIMEGLQKKIQGLSVDALVKTEEPLADFQDEVANLFAHQEEKIDPAIVVARMEDAFTQLVSSLQMTPSAHSEEGEDIPVQLGTVDNTALLDTLQKDIVTEPEEPTMDQPISAELTGDSTPQTTTLTELTDWFRVQMEELQANVNEFRNLPPLSEANREDIAYNKFLAIYNEMWGIAEGSDQKGVGASSDGVNTEV